MNIKHRNPDLYKMSFDKQCAYLMEVQQPYLKCALVTFFRCEKMIRTKHSNENNTTELTDLLLRLGKLIEVHLNWEEEHFFPFLRMDMQHTWQTLRNLAAFLATLRAEHKAILALFDETRALSNDYTPSPVSSSTIKLCFAQLFDFEQDIIKHIFFEEHMVFPKLDKT